MARPMKKTPFILQVLGALKERGPCDSIPFVNSSMAGGAFAARRRRETLLNGGLVKFEKGRYSLTAAGEDFIK